MKTQPPLGGQAPNQPDATNPAMVLWLPVGDQRRRAAAAKRPSYA
jgi:hypothetical protein